MPKPRKATSTRKPPVPFENRTKIDEWLGRVMPDLAPIVRRIDELVTSQLDDVQYAIKWNKVYYGLPEQGWVIEMVAYDVSVNIVFLGGADFDSPPPLGDTNRSRYVKLRSLQELEDSDVVNWIDAASHVPGWS